MLTDKSISTVERYVWAGPVRGAPLFMSEHPAIHQIAARRAYSSDINGALRDSGMFRESSSRLYRVTIEEVEVTKVSWWTVEQEDGKTIAGNIGNHDGLQKVASAEIVDGKLRHYARVQATDEASAIAAANDAWRDLTARIGGAE